MATERLISPAALAPEEEQINWSLRPTRIQDYVGQADLIERLKIAMQAGKARADPMEHVLLHGPPGLGKTTFATVLPNELGTTIQMTSGPALSKPSDLLPFLTNAEDGSVLFIDEIHRMPRVVEEFIYPAMEDFRVDIVLGEGVNARTISLTLKHFTLIGATTRSGMLSGPMRDRFKMHEHLEFYSIEDLATIVRINAGKLGTEISDDACHELATRSRGTPRIANSRLWWVRNYAASEADGRISLAIAREALDMAEVDREGLDKQDRRYLETLVGVFDGGPTGVEAIAATMNLPSETLSDEVEPYLLREQFIIRTSRGRVAMPKTFELLGKPQKRKSGDGPSLFEPQGD